MFINNFLQSLRTSSKTQRIFELAVNSVLVLVFVLFVVRPAIGEITELRETQKEVNELQTNLRTKVNNLAQAETNVQSLSESFGLLYDAYPPEPQQFDLIAQVRSVAEVNGLEVSQISHRAETVGEVGFNLSAAGQYQSMVDFVSHLENIPRLIEVESISASVGGAETDAQNLGFTLTGKAFYYNREVNLLTE